MSADFKILHEPKIKKFLHGCKIFLLAGTAIIIISSLIVLSAYDVASRVQRGIFQTSTGKQVKNKYKHSFSNTGVSQSEKQR